MCRSIAPATLHAALSAVLVLGLSGCPVSTCPASLEDLDPQALVDRFGSDTIAGTAIVQRFVDARDPLYRGYDVDITSRVVGLKPTDQVMFVVAHARASTIELGAQVMFVGTRGARPAEIVEAGCPVLIPLQP